MEDAEARAPQEEQIRVRLRLEIPRLRQTLEDPTCPFWVHLDLLSKLVPDDPETRQRVVDLLRAEGDQETRPDPRATPNQWDETPGGPQPPVPLPRHARGSRRECADSDRRPVRRDASHKPAAGPSKPWATWRRLTRPHGDAPGPIRPAPRRDVLRGCLASWQAQAAGAARCCPG